MKAAFLDRDGVINTNFGYVYQQTKFQWIDGVFAACRQLIQADFQLFIITNQSGIGRGYYSETDFHQLMAWVITEFSKEKITITDYYFCPHHPTEAKGCYKKQCQCRKPHPGLLLQAIKDYKIDINQSVMFGDKQSDIDAANQAHIKKSVLIDQSGLDFRAIKANFFQANSLYSAVTHLYKVNAEK